MIENRYCLLETHCISVLTYAIEVIEIADRDERRKLRVAYNSIFRKLFGYRDWESVTELQHALKRPTWEELIEKRTAKFLHSFAQCSPLSMNWYLSSVSFVLFVSSASLLYLFAFYLCHCMLHDYHVNKLDIYIYKNESMSSWMNVCMTFWIQQWVDEWMNE